MTCRVESMPRRGFDLSGAMGVLALGLAACAVPTAFGADAPGAAGTGTATTLNPVKDWVPVISEFRIVAPGAAAWRTETRRGWKQVAMPEGQKGPSSIPRAWQELRKIFAFGDYSGSLDPMFSTDAQRAWPQDRPVLAGWRTWSKAEGASVESGIEVLPSDVPEVSGQGWQEVVPVLGATGESGLQIGLQIWGAGRLEDEPTLTPADDEYQRKMRDRVSVLEFELKGYRLVDAIPSWEKGDWNKEIRSAVATEQVVDLMEEWKKANFGYTHLGTLFNESGMEGSKDVLFLNLGRIPQMLEPAKLYEVRLRARLLLRDFGAESQSSDEDQAAKEKSIQARIRYGIVPRASRFQTLQQESGRYDPPRR